MARDAQDAALREALERVEAARPALRRRAPHDIARVVRAAWASIADPELALGRAARMRLPESTGLSLEMIAWALSSSLGEERLAALDDAVDRMAGPPGAHAAPVRLAVLVLAGNVFSACVAPWSLSLVARSPLLVKASSRDDVLPRLFHAALAEADPELADACAVVRFAGGSPALETTLFSRADVVSAYGSDTTIASIRARVPPDATFLPHGHGLGVAFVSREALASDEAALAAADAISLDVAAYDQRGCMSPHAVFVERGGRVEALTWAEALSSALERRSRELPRGPLPNEVGVTQLQWRGVAAARGELFEGDGWAVSYEGARPLRVSPGWRNVMVVDVDDVGAFARSVQDLGVHLKTVGVAGSVAVRRAVARALDAPLSPRVCAAGQMQTPELFGLADGRPAWEGLLRYVQID